MNPLTMMAVMENPGNMSNLDMAVMLLVLMIIAGIPVVLSLGALILGLGWKVVKWVCVGMMAWIGWHVGEGLFSGGGDLAERAERLGRSLGRALGGN